MGRIEELFKRLKRNKGYLLAEGDGKLALLNNTDSSKKTSVSTNEGRESFKKQLQIEQKVDENIEKNDEELDDESTYYNAKFVVRKNNWYEDRQLREEYYKMPSVLKYFGNLKLFTNSDDIITIKCNYNDNNEQEQSVELGRTQKRDMHRAMRIIENIIDLQNVLVTQGANLEKDIQAEYKKLEDDEEFEFSALGKIILSYNKKQSLRLPIVKEDDLYKKAILPELETEENVSEIPIIELQAKVEEEKMNEVIQEFIKFSKLAIDIGALSNQDWKDIDKRNRNFRILGNKDYNCVGDIFYERKSSYRKESFDKIEIQYFDEADKKEVETVAKKSIIDNHETIHYKHYIEDAKESAIRKHTRKKVIEYAGLLEKCIGLYKKNNPKEQKDINILNDMLTFSQINRIKQLGLTLDKEYNENLQKDGDELE